MSETVSVFQGAHCAVMIRIDWDVEAFEALDEEVLVFSGRDDGDDGFTSVQGFKALAEHNIEVVWIKVG